MKREIFSYVFAVEASDVVVAVMIIYVGLRGVPTWCDRFLSAVSPFLSHPQNSEISVFETQCRFRTPAPHITHTMLLEVSVALFTVLCLRLLGAGAPSSGPAGAAQISSGPRLAADRPGNYQVLFNRTTRFRAGCGRSGNYQVL